MTGRLCALALAMASFIACSSAGNGSGPPAIDDAGTDVTTTVDGSEPDSLPPSPTTVSQTVGTAGATVSAPGISLVVPPGALASDTVITITPNAGAVPAGYTGLSPLYAFGPNGTTFLQPVTVDFTLTTPGTSPVVMWSNAQGGYDVRPTTATATTAAATVSHFSEGFVCEHHDAGAPGPGLDAGAPSDAATLADVESPESGSQEAGGVDAGVTEAGGGNEAGMADASGTGNDAGLSDAASGDSAAASDAGVLGITVTIDGVATSFTSSPTVSNVNSLSTVTANDNPSSTHWQMQLLAGTIAQEVCSTGVTYPMITYTHFTNGVADSVFSTKQTQGYCNFVVTGTATVAGQHTKGIFSGGVDAAPDAGGPFVHLLSGGTYDVIF